MILYAHFKIATKMGSKAIFFKVINILYRNVVFADRIVSFLR